MRILVFKSVDNAVCIIIYIRYASTYSRVDFFLVLIAVNIIVFIPNIDVGFFVECLHFMTLDSTLRETYVRILRKFFSSMIFRKQPS